MKNKRNHHEKELEKLLEQEKETRQAMLNMLEDLQEQRDHIARAHREWIDAFDAIDDAVMLHDIDGNVMRLNRAYKELSGAEKYKDLIGRPYWHAFPKGDGFMHSCAESVKTGKVAEEECKLEDGRIVKSRTFPVSNAEGQYIYGIHLFEDITDIRSKEEQIVRLNQTLRLISHCNEMLVRSISERALIQNICDEIIRSDYEFAGVYFRQDESIVCEYHKFAGEVVLGVEGADLAAEEYRDCPVYVCIDERRSISINDIANDPQWVPLLRKHSEVCPAAPYDMQGSMLVLPLISDGLEGAFVVYSRLLKQFDEEKGALFTELADDMAFGVHTLRLRERFERVSNEREEMVCQLKESLYGTVRSVAMMVEARDPYTSGHQNRVAELAVAIAKRMGVSEHRIEGIRLAGIVHDIGKIKIPSEILTKPTALTDLEYEMIKTHPQTGYDILKDIKFVWPIAQMIYQHHEHVDGTGYPNGLKDEEILLEAKILSVADVVEAMASHRPYRASLGVSMALKEIKAYSGTFYDRDVVKNCIELFEAGEFTLD